MRVALKLYASLADHLPPDARRTNRLELELPPDTTVDEVIRERNLRRSCATWCWSTDTTLRLRPRLPPVAAGRRAGDLATDRRWLSTKSWRCARR